ncbi:winged helix family two component transcriptional regulator [Paenibacillus alvei TS-15]|jgi:DNA-binding response OmpR family regulator|uniref:Response regulator transcription factor n=2 Tax=Paenibacillus alvei TaxID=44250 RepID=A0A383RB20_PAEAL|nr:MULTISPECIES: response regulator transcription factor [Paenibacillus]EPY05178.1 winged helix family two component transcriptional regulator [Paenibacillus alvei TS-15]EPY13199.1 winged helix family two component transcriptional regulator [Paenibacillus alvei A6-6i-x]MCM3290792.1 response regulator transcription factor [Paenibacillus sp. MER 180]MCY9529839.1 response regulator transcription factor [Paenibacillus alvei]OBY79627.1 DNA-binding response regulator [Paenibacillus sp. KS1]
MTKILILEDEESIRSFIVINLKRNGFDVVEADNGNDAYQMIMSDPTIDIALLDVMVPGIDGFEVCRRVREQNERLGIIFLTAKVQEQDKVYALSVGADDHVSKPFSPTELVARIQSLLRRVSSYQHTTQKVVYQSGPFSLDLIAKRFTKNNQAIDLTPTEFSLVQFFMEKEEMTLSRDVLLDHVWGKDYMGDPKIVDVNIRRLRQKIEDEPSSPRFLETVWGHGYKWKGTTP